MKTEFRISLIVAALLGLAAPGFGQGSMSRYTASAQNTLGRGKSLPSMSGLTINAQRRFDHSVAITVSSATRSWFLDPTGTSDAMVATGRYENTSLWAQASPAKPVLVFARSRSVNANSRQLNSGDLEYSPLPTISQLAPASAQYDEGQLSAWVQSNIRFVRVDPTPNRTR